MDTIALVLLGLLAIWGLIDMPRAWRQKAVTDKPVWGSAWAQRRQDARRSILVTEVGVIAFVVALARRGTILIAGCVFFGAALLTASIHLFNRPRFLVPPAFRYDPGALDRFRRHRQGPRSNDAPPR